MFHHILKLEKKKFVTIEKKFVIKQHVGYLCDLDFYTCNWAALIKSDFEAKHILVL